MRNKYICILISTIICICLLGVSDVYSKTIENSFSIRDSIPPYIITTSDLSLSFDNEGKIINGTYTSGDGKKLKKVNLEGGSVLVDFKSKGVTSVKKLQNGGYEFRRWVINNANESCLVSDRFTPTKNSIHWEMTVESNKKYPWSTPMVLSLKYPATKKIRFWTSWVNRSSQNSDCVDNDYKVTMKDQDHIWVDPLETMPLMDNCWNYGGEKGSSGICIPIASILDEMNNIGLNLIVSPDQPLLSLKLKTRSDGTVEFHHSFLRLGNNRKVSFSADIVKEEADWRGGLRWMVSRFADYFDPPNPEVQKMGGLGAYSHHQGELDTAFLKRTGFRVNWDASFGWPYFGMFFPPVNRSETWISSGPDHSGRLIPSLQRVVSYHSMDDYSSRMRKMGFFVLDYFNLTEFGTHINETQVKPDLDKKTWWKDANTYLYRKMPNGFFRERDDTSSVYSWGRSVVIDPGDKGVEENLVMQAEYYVNSMPNSSGICIDRLDHVMRVNFAKGADDMIGWYDGRPGRFIGFSWRNIMPKISSIIHGKNKVIYCNVLKSHRLEWLKEFDGIYNEWGYMGMSLNGSALLALRKPAMMWTYDTSSIKPDPDSYFQRHLHLGTYPTAPFEGNDHTIRPGTGMDRYYIEYGPLFDAILGKRWVLIPHCVATSTDGVKVNLFEIPSGYAMPVTLGDTISFATVLVRNLKDIGKLKCEAILPGEASAVPISAIVKDGVLEMKVPLKKGCAMVKMYNP